MRVDESTAVKFSWTKNEDDISISKTFTEGLNLKFKNINENVEFHNQGKNFGRWRFIEIKSKSLMSY